MSFLEPQRLWLLLLVAGLVLAYLAMQRRRRAYAVRFTALPLLDRVAPRNPGWRRHAPALAFVVMLVALVTGFARPEKDVEVPREEATVMVVLDVSISMRAEDVPPDRITIARAAANQFVDLLPESFNVGLVTFSENVTVAVSPTIDRQEMHDAIDRTRLAGGTAIGDAVIAAVTALRPPVPEGAPPETSVGPPARIVLLSDGDNTAGRPVSAGIDAAREAGIPVSTIAYGTPEGTVELEGRTLRVPADEETLAELAESTGGEAYVAASAEELRGVYEDLGSSIGYRVEKREVTTWFVGAGLVAAALAAFASMAWFSRLP